MSMEWIDSLFDSKEDAAMLPMEIATKILKENIPPNAYPIQQFQNDLDYASKRSSRLQFSNKSAGGN